METSPEEIAEIFNLVYHKALVTPPFKDVHMIFARLFLEELHNRDLTVTDIFKKI